MIRNMLALFISPFVGYIITIAYFILSDWVENHVIRPMKGLPSLGDDWLWEVGVYLPMVFMACFLGTYFLSIVIGGPTVSFLLKAKRGKLIHFILTALLVGTVLGLLSGILLIEAAIDSIWGWLEVITLLLPGTLAAYITCWLIIVKSKAYF